MQSVVQAITARQKLFINRIQKGQGGLAAKALYHYAFPITKDSVGLTSNIGLDNPGGIDKEMNAAAFIVSTFDEDRDGDIVVPMGINLSSYKRNPVWFFGHQEWPVPIGTSKSPQGKLCVWPEENRVVAKCFFDTEDEDAMFIFGKVQRGLLNATSIAFVPIRAHRRDYEEKANPRSSPLLPPGWLFQEVDLTEISIVGVPANAGAIRDALDREKNFITPRLQKALSSYAAKAKGCWYGWCPCPPCGKKSVSKMSHQAAQAQGLEPVFPEVHQHGQRIFYDSKAGKYYDASTDMYLTLEEVRTFGIKSTKKSTRFSTWEQAHAEAQKLANQTGQDVAIRKVREYGKEGFNVSFASRNDSDYARAEIVKPDKVKSMKQRRKGHYDLDVAQIDGKWWLVDDQGHKLKGPFSSEAQAEAALRQGTGFELGKDSKPSDKIPSGKACQILEDGEANGKPLTDSQRAMFGAACGRKQGKKKIAVDSRLTGNTVVVLGVDGQRLSGMQFGTARAMVANGDAKVVGTDKIQLIHEPGTGYGQQGKNLNGSSGASGGYLVNGEPKIVALQDKIRKLEEQGASYDDPRIVKLCREISALEEKAMKTKPSAKKTAAKKQPTKKAPAKPVKKQAEEELLEEEEKQAPFEGEETPEEEAAEHEVIEEVAEEAVEEAPAEDEVPPDIESELAEEDVPYEAALLAKIYDHQKSLMDYLGQEQKRVGPEMREYIEEHKNELNGHMERYKEVLGERYPDHDMDKCLKALGMGKSGDGEDEDEIPVIEKDTEEEVAEAADAIEEVAEAEAEEEAVEEEPVEEEVVAEEEMPEEEMSEEEPVEEEVVAEEEVPEDKEVDSAEDEILERYQQQPKGKKAGVSKKALVKKACQCKSSCNKGHYDVVRGASDHMGALAEAEDLPKYHKAGLLYHSKAMDDLCKELEGLEEQIEEKQDELEEVEKYGVVPDFGGSPQVVGDDEGRDTTCRICGYKPKNNADAYRHVQQNPGHRYKAKDEDEEMVEKTEDEEEAVEKAEDEDEEMVEKTKSTKFSQATVNRLTSLEDSLASLNKVLFQATGFKAN